MTLCTYILAFVRQCQMLSDFSPICWCSFPEEPKINDETEENNLEDNETRMFMLQPYYTPSFSELSELSPYAAALLWLILVHLLMFTLNVSFAKDIAVIPRPTERRSQSYAGGSRGIL